MNVDSCLACCRSSLPTPDRPNPVVASLVCDAANRLLELSSLDADQSVRLLESRKFAVRFLATATRVDAPAAGVATSEVFFNKTNAQFDNESARPKTTVVPREIERIRAAIHAGWRSLHVRKPAIGLIGVNNQRGLGCQNRQIARELNVDRWLLPVLSEYPSSMEPGDEGVPVGCRTELAGPDTTEAHLSAWLRGLDQIVFVERPFFEWLPALARHQGVTVTCVANWEWLHPGLEWTACVDLMIAPTRFTQELLSRWKRQFGFTWQVEYLPWPIDSATLKFRQRKVCRQFLFVNGAGGIRPTCRNGAPANYRRKGFDVLCEAARLVPEIPIIAYSQTGDIPRLPPNVELRAPRRCSADLYREGDVCLQPSHWEGLGLPLLECQAAGLPLATTDVPPMNEYQPLAVIPPDRPEVVSLGAQFHIAAPAIRPEDVAGVMVSLYGRDIALDSLQARQFIERTHAWRSGWQTFRGWMSPSRTPLLRTRENQPL